MSIRDILEKLLSGKLSIEDAEKMIKIHGIQRIIDFARIDIGRELRRGIPELVLSEGKTDDQLLKIIEDLLNSSNRVIVTRLGKERYTNLIKQLVDDYIFEYNERARILIIRSRDYTKKITGGKVAILTAGTHDIPVAEEAKVIVEEMGCYTKTYYDVGAAGIHRLLEPLKEIIEWDADVLVVVAGREGALPTVVGSFVDIPIIAVPTSSGYGYGGSGESALMAMLQSCSLGIGVVNIDSGVAAGVLAAMIANRVAKFRSKSTK